jgi:hypothetical protein
LPKASDFRRFFNMKARFMQVLFLTPGTALALAIVALGQPVQMGKAHGTITGRVSIDNKGEPGVVVTLKPDAGGGVGFGGEQEPAITAVTDEEGRYRLSNIIPGSYRLSAFAPTYAAQGDGDFFKPGKPVNLMEGENLEGQDLFLVKGGVITGRVTDEDGRNVIAEPVRIYRLGPDNKPQPDSGFLTMFSFWETDDRGVYRIFGLGPGKYWVAVGGAAMGNIPHLGGKGGGYYLPTFYPGTVNESQAEMIEVEGGGVTTDVDIKIASPSKLFIASGRVVDADTGQAIAGVQVSCSIKSEGSQIQTPFANTLSAGTARTDSLGEFRIEGLRPSRYRAYIFDAKSSDPISGQVEFEISDSNVNGLEVSKKQGSVISGIVVIEGSNAPNLNASLVQMGLIAQNLSDPMALTIPVGRGEINPDGSFKLTNIKPGRTRILMGVGGPKGLSLIRVEHQGHDVREFNVSASELISGVRLIFAYGTGVIAGRVEITGGALPPGARLRVRAAREGEGVASPSTPMADIDGQGRFTIEGLLQGTYKLTLLHGQAAVQPTGVEQIIHLGGTGRQEVVLRVDLSQKGRNQ